MLLGLQTDSMYKEISTLLVNNISMSFPHAEQMDWPIAPRLQ